MDKTFAKGLQLIEVLAKAEAPVTVTALSAMCGFTKSNVHRLLGTLSELGYVTQDPASKRYMLTLKIWELGYSLIERLDLKQAASPYMHEMNDFSGESTQLSVLDHGEVIYVDKLEAKYAVQTITRVGGRAPAYCVASGKAMLSHQPQAAIDRICENLVRYTDATITDPFELREEFEQIRTQGYAVNRGEWRAVAHGVAVPIWGSNNTVIASIGVSGPKERLSLDRVTKLAPVFQRIGSDMSRALGCTKLPKG